MYIFLAVFLSVILYIKFGTQSIRVLRKDGVVFSYKTTGAAGIDLSAYCKEPQYILPGERLLVQTGLSIELPEGYEAQVRPRSGLALKYGVTVLNSPGTIDSDYRGEIGVILINLGMNPFVINPGDRIAQLVVCKYERLQINHVLELTETTRGVQGFGSTGTK